MLAVHITVEKPIWKSTQNGSLEFQLIYNLQQKTNKLVEKLQDKGKQF